MKFFTCKIILLALVVTLHASWQKAADVLTATNGVAGDFFGYSVAVGEQFAVVGAPDDAIGGTVYVFEKNNYGHWIQIQKFDYNNLLYSTGLQSIELKSIGFDVALAESSDSVHANPHLIVIGAPDSTITDNNSVTSTVGAVCTLEYNSTASLFQKQNNCLFGSLLANDNHDFGYSVDISSWVDTVHLGTGTFYYPHAKMVVGDPNIDDNTYSDTGSVSFFDYNVSSHQWNSVAVVDNPKYSGHSNVHFGYSVAIDKVTVLIGAPDTAQDSPTVIAWAGTAYFYNANGSLIGEYPPNYTDTTNGHGFGTSVDIKGDYAIIGENHHLGISSFGGAYILKKSGTDWLENHFLEGTVDSYGKSVAINSRHVVIGAPTRNYLDKSGHTVYTGAVYMYDNNGSDGWNESMVDTGGHDSFFGYGISLNNDAVMVGAHKDELVQSYDFKSGFFNPAILIYLLD